ncbi:Magnesium and cobalt efflux protein CorC [Methylobrevis pamukkalensis]|uniref:Magnesium and cobalt efflux protein CorC n=1 Tax=Methylobrevis pamukkalensis TaxID=1439726 RepID=A0A1E3H691_9HYPH|nr:Magnesium and cobalt efflux protein CorC [Methylobrevis pamukkalensis]
MFRFGDSSAKGLMTPRTEVDWLPFDASPDVLRERLAKSPHSRLPVCRNGLDDIVGVIAAKDLLAALVEGSEFTIADLIRPAPVVPDTMGAPELLEVLRAADVPMALVHDEYGDFDGLVTPADVLGAIVGGFKSDLDAEEDTAYYQRDDGSWMISGSMPVDAMADIVGLKLPKDRGYHTAAGFVLARLGHLPATGETFTCLGWRFEVVDMDGLRIDKIAAERLPHGTRQK